MRWSLRILAGVLALQSSILAAAADKQLWGFSGAKIVVARKGDTVPTSTNEFTLDAPVPSPITLGSGEVLRVSLSFQVEGELAVPHQAYVLMRHADSQVETFFPMDVAINTAKAKLELSQKDIPPLFISTSSRLDLYLAVGDFTPDIQSILVPIGGVQLAYDALTVNAAAKSAGPAPLKYQALPEIRHTFRADPKNPPVVITLVFLGSVVAALGGLFISWAAIGANLSALPTALKSAPISHPTFFTSLLALEGIFVLYYLKWNLFQTLAAVGLVGPVAFLSGSRALREVRARRVKGER